MLTSMLLCAALAPPAGDEAAPVVRVSAELVGPELVVGGHHEIVLRVEIGSGWSAGAAGIPGALLQIDAPDAIDLDGEKLTSYEQLKRNEFLEAPWERLLEGSEARIGFTLRAEPAEGTTVGLNVVAYLAQTAEREDGEAAALVFVRRRVDLPLAVGATAASDLPSRRSSWGRNGTLQIGEQAEPFELPRADGTRVSIAERLGKAPLIVTTQRAFW